MKQNAIDSLAEQGFIVNLTTGIIQTQYVKK